MWLKGIAFGAYAVVLLIATILVLSGVKTKLAWPALPIWRPDQLAQMGFMMWLFMVTVIWLQAKSPPSGVLAMQVAVTGALLVATLLRHGFPEQSAMYAVPHLICAIGFACWNISKIIRLGR